MFLLAMDAINVLCFKRYGYNETSTRGLLISFSNIIWNMDCAKMETALYACSRKNIERSEARSLSISVGNAAKYQSVVDTSLSTSKTPWMP